MNSNTDKITLEAMAERYLKYMLQRGDSQTTVDVRRRYLRYFREWAQIRGFVEVQEIQRQDIEAYQQYLFNYRKEDGEPLSWASQKSRISAIKQWFSYMTQKYIILYNPASEIVVPKEGVHLPKDILSPEDVEKICAQIPLNTVDGIRDRMIVEIFWATGMRRRAVANLHLNDIDFLRETIFIRQGKGRKDRYVPLSARCEKWIRFYLEEARDKLLGDEEDSKALILTIHGQPMPADYFTQLIGRYVKRADIGKSGSCHIFRHSCATNMLDNGCDIRLIQELLGHGNLKTTQRYTQVSIKKLQEAHKLTHPTCVPSKSKSEN